MISSIDFWSPQQSWQLWSPQHRATKEASSCLLIECAGRIFTTSKDSTCEVQVVHHRFPPAAMAIVFVAAAHVRLIWIASIFRVPPCASVFASVFDWRCLRLWPCLVMLRCGLQTNEYNVQIVSALDLEPTKQTWTWASVKKFCSES